MSPIVWIVLIVLAVVVIGGILIYNGLVQRRLRIREAYAQIEVQLKRRWDLIPNLVNAVKGYMGFEQSVLENVTAARANAVSAGAQGPAASAGAENALTGSLRSLFAVVENYPALRSAENVRALQEEISRLENVIADRRELYNDQVFRYNTRIAQVPASIVAGPMGWTPAPFFKADDDERARPSVELNTA